MGWVGGWRYDFTPKPWPELLDFYGEFEGMEHMSAIVRSVLDSDVSDQLAAATSLLDLRVAATPIRPAPVEILWIEAPNSVKDPRPRPGFVRIRHLSSTGLDDSIERPVAEAVPLFWRFAKEKFGVQATRDV